MFRPQSFIERRDGKLEQHKQPPDYYGLIKSKYNIRGAPRVSPRRIRKPPVHVRKIIPPKVNPHFMKLVPKRPKKKKVLKHYAKMSFNYQGHKHRDILKLSTGDRILFTKHDHNFLVCTGFVAAIYNDNHPALRFVAYIQEEYKDLTLKFEYEEALPVKALGSIHSWPALYQVVLVLVERLVIIDDKLVMLLPEEEKRGEKKFMYAGHSKRDGIHSHHDVGQHEVTDRTHEHIGTKKHEVDDKNRSIRKYEPTSVGTLLFRGTRGPEKDRTLSFRVREYILSGIGRCFRFHVDEVLKQPQANNKADYVDDGRTYNADGTLKNKDKSAKKSVEFYYSTTLFQNILSALEELKKKGAKRDIARNMCKWIDVLRAEVSEAGIDEIVFDLSRINMDIQLFEKVPGDGQKRLNKRVSAPKYTRIHFSNGSNLPKWNTHTKTITKTEKMNAQLSPVGIDRVQYRVVTPDSVLFARSKQKVLALNGDFLMRKGAINNTDFVQKRLKPVERCAKVGNRHKNKYQSLEMAFYHGHDEYFKRNMPHFAQPTKQFLAQRYKCVIEKEMNDNMEEKQRESKRNQSHKNVNFPYKQIPRIVLDSLTQRETPVYDDSMDTRPALEVTTNYSKGAVAAKILLTSDAEAEKRKRNAIRKGRSYTPVQPEFKIL